MSVNTGRKRANLLHRDKKEGGLSRKMRNTENIPILSPSVQGTGASHERRSDRTDKIREKVRNNKNMEGGKKKGRKEGEKTPPLPPTSSVEGKRREQAARGSERRNKIYTCLSAEPFRLKNMDKQEK